MHVTMSFVEACRLLSHTLQKIGVHLCTVAVDYPSGELLPFTALDVMLTGQSTVQSKQQLKLNSHIIKYTRTL